MLKERVLTAVIGGSILLGMIYLGGNFALFASIILLSVSAYEISTVAGFTGYQKIIIIACALISFFALKLSMPLLVIFLAGAFIMTMKNTKGKTYLPSLYTVYVAVAYFLFFEYSKKPFDLFPALALLIVVWSSDTVAYFVGIYLGKIKIAPKISPHKTLEGTFSGIIAGSLAFFFAHNSLNEIENTISVFLIGFTLSTAAFFGDLFESYFKRQFGVKDSGKILPGHGGVLDRFDSVNMVFIVFGFLKLLRVI